MHVRTKLMVICASVVALVGLSAVTAVAAPGDTTGSNARDKAAGTSYTHVINNNSGKCMAVPGGNTNAGSNLIQWDCGNYADHYWNFVNDYDDNNGYEWDHVVNSHSGQCLAVPGGSTAAGTKVIQWPCGNYADHLWRRVDMGNYNFELVNYNSGLCLSVPGASTADGVQLIQWPCAYYPDQYWNFG